MSPISNHLFSNAPASSRFYSEKPTGSTESKTSPAEAKPTEAKLSDQQNASAEPTPETGESKKSKKRDFYFTWRRLGISTALAAAWFSLIYYIRMEKEREWEKERQRSLGKAAIGGSFDLVDTNNKPVSNRDFLGKWLLIYFGFTHCPDVCPEEIEKMVEVYHRTKKFYPKAEIVPLFISVDPDRDTPEIVKKYCAEFSPEIIGLTGNREQIKVVSKNYRVYFSPGPKSKDKDYIVDHTIIMYLINPDGEFVDYYGQTRDAEMVTNAVLINMKKYEAAKRGSWFG